MDTFIGYVVCAGEFDAFEAACRKRYGNTKKAFVMVAAGCVLAVDPLDDEECDELCGVLRVTIRNHRAGVPDQTSSVSGTQTE